MKIAIYATTLVALVAPAAPSMALDIPQSAVMRQDHAAGVELVDWRYRPHRHHPRYGGYVGPNGGYRVNRYGYGNYVGRRGGFAGYPAGSAGAQIYRQKQERKCQDVPEMC